MSFRDTDSAAFRAALDRHITGNWGADAEPDPGPRCMECGEHTWGSQGIFECEGCGREIETETVCARPGRYGCGDCGPCCDWADAEHDRMDD